MPKISEKRIERYLVDQVKKQLGGKALKFNSSGYSGAPDRLIVLPGGWAAFAEIKAPGKILRPLQEKRCAELAALGFFVGPGLDTLRAVDEFIERLKAYAKIQTARVSEFRD